jgi:hypothetical protein
MHQKITLFVMAVLLASAAAEPALAREEHVHQGRCGGDGLVGTIAGGAGGAVLGKVLIGGPVAIVAGAAGGALLGRHLDRQHSAKRQGCSPRNEEPKSE